LAIDLITKRHECSYLFYLIDIAILFVGIPQGQSTFLSYRARVSFDPVLCWCPTLAILMLKR